LGQRISSKQLSPWTKPCSEADRLKWCQSERTVQDYAQPTEFPAASEAEESLEEEPQPVVTEAIADVEKLWATEDVAASTLLIRNQSHLQSFLRFFIGIKQSTLYSDEKRLEKRIRQKTLFCCRTKTWKKVPKNKKDFARSTGRE